jgi:hypothetical protein
MPIGFWAISRNDLKELWETKNELYPAEKVTYTEHDLDMLAKNLPECLDAVVDLELGVQREHRRIQNRKH